MTAGWLTRSSADVPAGDAWLGARERAVLAGLRVAKRRADWRLGRWTAKAALGAFGVAGDPARLEILAAPDGAPEAWRDGRRLGLSLSLSHRAGLALAAAAREPRVIGCAVELVEPRSDAFVREWLAPQEQARLGGDPDLQANLAWSAKEAAAKVRREGLRLDVRRAVATAGETPAAGGWRPLNVDWTTEGTRPAGWWRRLDGYVLTVASEPGGPPPQAL